MAITMKDVAQLAGVTEATVSNALNNTGNVSEATRKRILNIARTMGYTPNVRARQLARQKTQTIGIVVPDIENPYYSMMVKEISENCRQYGYRAVIADSDEDAATEAEIISYFVSERVEGILISPINNLVSRIDYIHNMEDYDIRYCFIGAYPPNLDCSWVMIDLEKGSYLLVKHLLNNGLRRICFLLGHQLNLVTSTRLQGYKKALKEFNLEQDERLLINCDAYTFESAYTVTTRLLESGDYPDAIIALNDLMALGCLRALAERGIAVPQRISVAGYDDLLFASVSTIPLTTVRQDVPGLSKTSVNLLMNMIKNGQDNTHHVLLQPELIIRNSTI